MAVAAIHAAEEANGHNGAPGIVRAVRLPELSDVQYVRETADCASGRVVADHALPTPGASAELPSRHDSRAALLDIEQLDTLDDRSHTTLV